MIKSMLNVVLYIHFLWGHVIGSIIAVFLCGRSSTSPCLMFDARIFGAGAMNSSCTAS